jgi:hypothetical protein
MPRKRSRTLLYCNSLRLKLATFVDQTKARKGFPTRHEINSCGCSSSDIGRERSGRGDSHTSSEGGSAPTRDSRLTSRAKNRPATACGPRSSPAIPSALRQPIAASTTTKITEGRIGGDPALRAGSILVPQSRDRRGHRTRDDEPRCQAMAWCGSPPTRSNACSCKSRRTLACTAGGISPTSSSNRVPP